MKIFYFLLCFFYFFSASAAGDLALVERNCSMPNWEQWTVNIRPDVPAGLNYNMSPIYGLREDFLGGISAIIDASNRNANCSDLDKLTEVVERLAHNKNLNPLRKACLVKCVTAYYLRYEAPSNVDSACWAARAGTVDCKGYAALADYLLEQLGENSNSVVSVEHAFNRVRHTDNQWYYFEPRAFQCEFFQP